MREELGPLSQLEPAMTSVEQSSSTSPIPSAESTPHVVTCESRTPSRSRTPWDAGGYSLPLASDPFSIRTSSLPRIPHDRESPTDQPSSVDFKGASPQHKFSDSRSSLSSYTPSSTASVSHSRISSLSTVGEDQTFDIDTAADKPSLLKTRDQHSTTPDSNSYTDKDKDASIPQLIQVVSDIYLARYPSSSSQRPQSPSDAVLITREQELDKIDTRSVNHCLPLNNKSHVPSSISERKSDTIQKKKKKTTTTTTLQLFLSTTNIEQSHFTFLFPSHPLTTHFDSFNKTFNPLTSS